MSSEWKSGLKPEIVLSVVWGMLPLIARYLVWAWIFLAHLVLGFAALTLLWWTETSPSDLDEIARSALQSKPVAALTFVGVSVLSVATGYWKLLRWAHSQAGDWLIDTVVEELRGRS